MKQKVVVKIDMHDDKSRSKAMKIAVGVPGVLSASIEGADKNQIAVVGDGVDSVDLTRQLRKRMGNTDLVSRLLLRKRNGITNLVSVTPVDEKKEEKKPEPTIPWPYQYHPFVRQPHFVSAPPYSTSDSCSIM